MEIATRKTQEVHALYVSGLVDNEVCKCVLKYFVKWCWVHSNTIKVVDEFMFADILHNALRSLGKFLPDKSSVTFKPHALPLVETYNPDADAIYPSKGRPISHQFLYLFHYKHLNNHLRNATDTKIKHIHASEGKSFNNTFISVMDVVSQSVAKAASEGWRSAVVLFLAHNATNQLKIIESYSDAHRPQQKGQRV
ncbi:uncharacterized protein ACA1_386680 [Acanthamoeba castellanii str. Neff]|uniref:Uncharacterized protein n=1 Tax=Acanthamoeba castellanii (strain ATCC 30010 / Neff) TaxID=1257118 RepID=L8H8L0_ACACF|nr:uncharacterized protein ACA1_386680 [Acanthamoeba castellanii str. Neff]ELR21849.1 hypothetical protein ACA1_386680 [Acanthamoeba castellanii str. Neff]